MDLETVHSFLLTLLYAQWAWEDSCSISKQIKINLFMEPFIS